MKTIGKRDFSQNQIFEIIFKGVEVQLDESMVDFLDQAKIKEPLIPIQDITKKVQELNSFAIEEITQMKRENNIYFTRAYLLFLIVSIVQQRKLVRKSLIQFFVKTLNERPQGGAMLSKPFLILMTPYGQGGLGPQISDLSKIPKLYPMEADTIQRNCEQSFIISLAYTDLIRVRDSFPLAESSFGMFLQANKISSEFLNSLKDQHSLLRNIGLVAKNVAGFLFTSRLGKVSPSQDVTTWVELAGALKFFTNQNIEYVIEEFSEEETSEEPESSQKQGDSVRNWTTLNKLFLQEIISLMHLTENTLKRYKSDFQEATNKAYFQLSNQMIEKSIQNGSLVKVMEPSNNQFGGSIPYLFRLFHFFENWENAFKLETLTAIEILQSMKKKIPEKPQQEGEEKQNDKKKEQAAQQILVGRGGTKILDDYALICEKFTTPEDREKQFREVYFSRNNKDLIYYLVSTAFYIKTDESKKPQPPKGTRDFDPKDMSIRKRCFDTITDVFRKHGAVQIDTPVFELKETLMGKYGEESKLVYDLEDQGGQMLSLRYDLTVPFARYMATKAVPNIKRYHIAQVYRRDQPNEKQGRFREFYQCDFDIAGSYDPMIPDAEIIKVIDEILTDVNLGSPYVIKINSRKLLDAIVEISGSPQDKFKQICSAIDKLDKLEWKDVRKELIEEKGLSPEQADKIGKFVEYQGEPFALLKELNEKKMFDGSKSGLEGMKDMELLFNYLLAFEAIKNVSFDLSLARGLDYYTGMIFEVVVIGKDVGSISGGGRYDGLLGMFSNKPIPAVGGSIGVERIFSIMARNLEGSGQVRESQTEVLIATVREGCCIQKMRIANELWKNKIKTQIIYLEKPKPQRQFEYAFKQFIPFIVLIGEDEIKTQTVKFKTMYMKKDEETVARKDLVEFLHAQIKQYNVDLLNDRVVFEEYQPETSENEKKKE